MTRRPSRHVAAAVLAGLAATGGLMGCGRDVTGRATASWGTVPQTPAELEQLIVGRVPSGLPRLPDAELHPPAGEKSVEDVAGYADDPAREREVLEEYGYRFGWERFWGETDGWPVTSVFVDQFENRAGADAYAADLARNDAELYQGVLRERTPQLPGGCRLMTVPDEQPETDLPGPTAFAWCGHGFFSVSVTAVAGDLEAATAEVQEVLDAQLDRLPPG